MREKEERDCLTVAVGTHDSPWAVGERLPCYEHASASAQHWTRKCRFATFSISLSGQKLLSDFTKTLEQITCSPASCLNPIIPPSKVPCIRHRDPHPLQDRLNITCLSPPVKRQGRKRVPHCMCKISRCGCRTNSIPLVPAVRWHLRLLCTAGQESPFVRVPGTVLDVST